jgi:CRISPR-associated endonuclease/helicase Cas3
VVVNRVDTAVAVHRELVADARHDVLLLTGRMRALDRDRLYRRYEPRLRTGRSRAAAEDGRPLILVATQTVEAGADLDLDALVTECAPLDALVQRFGRVDRDGRLSAAGRPVPSVVLATSAQVKDGDDPVYGPALAATWHRLAAPRALDRPDADAVDFGVDALAATLPTDDRDGLLSPRAAGPALLSSHLDRWVQTSTPPHADPDPALWLHGLQPPSPDITLVWRADLTPGRAHPRRLRRRC